VDDLPELLCGPDFQLHPEDRSNLLMNAEEAFRLLYKMVENILSRKEEEEIIRQAAGRGVRAPNPDVHSLP